MFWLLDLARAAGGDGVGSRGEEPGADGSYIAMGQAWDPGDLGFSSNPVLVPSIHCVTLTLTALSRQVLFKLWVVTH